MAMLDATNEPNPPTSSVVIGEAQNTGKDQAWCDWYCCPKCNKGNIARCFSFCPDCGVKLQWLHVGIDRPLPVLDDRTPEEICGYGDDGLCSH